MSLFVLLTLCIAAVIAVPFNPQRIVGGSVTTIDAYPQMVSLLYSWGGSSFWQACGGSLLNQRSVLTAAHCTIGDLPSWWRIRVGSTFANRGGVVHNVIIIINHPSYNSWTHNNDVAIVRVGTTINNNNQVRPANIAGSSYNIGDNQVVWATGWGATSQGGSGSEQLRHVQIWTVNQNICTQRYATVGSIITAQMLCTGWLDIGGRDQCQGDSGGPLFHNGVVVGVYSWGIGCAQAFFPSINARVSHYTTWIQSNA